MLWWYREITVFDTAVTVGKHVKNKAHFTNILNQPVVSAAAGKANFKHI